MGGRARAERDEWIRFQLGKRDASSKQTGKGRRADRNLPNFFDDRLRERRRERNRRCDDRKICRRLVQRRDGLRRGVVGDAQPDARVLGMEGAQLFGQVDVQSGLGGADADGTVLQRGAGAQLFFCILDLYCRRCNAGVQQLPLRR